MPRLDIDFEYPQNDAEAGFYVDLLRELRGSLDRHAQQKGDTIPYELTIAAVRRCSALARLTPTALRRVQLQQASRRRDGSAPLLLEPDELRL